jgi:nitrite reductase/ring-hydroxylating ferredoxin subunit
MAGGERVIARSEELAERGAGVRFVVERDGRALPAFAVRYDGVVRAYVNACAHRGVELDWEEGSFFDAWRAFLVCTSHGALYDPRDGRCVDGPCKGKALARVAVVERDGCVFVAPDG